MAYNIKADKNPRAVNIRKLQRYNFSFFTLEEVLFFEYLVVKAPLFKFKEFYHSTSTIAKEIGIKRSKLESIITKFGKMGLLSVEVKGFPKVKHFTVNFEKIRFFLPKIYQSAENGNRREMASDTKKKFSKTSLIANDVIVEKAAQALKRISENEINHAFIAYSDAIIADKVQPRKILPYFFTWQYGSYSVIEEYLDHFNVNYSIRK